jgi:hypothetical protein
MSPESAAQLGAFWSWLAASVAFVNLALLVPTTAGLLVGSIPLAVRRRDWRLTLPLFGVIAALLIAGAWPLTLVRPPAPALDFWVALIAEIGMLTFVIALISFLRLSLRRIREDRKALALVRATPEAAPGVAAEALEPGKRSRLNAIEAEYYVAEWMRYLGASESIVTPARRDGGVDVRSDFYIAQVKHRPRDFVSVDIVRALVGVASAEGRVPLVFTSGYYSRDALDFAGRVGAPLFIFRPAEGKLVGANASAAAFRTRGLKGRQPQTSPLDSVPL